jgi:hypothetical protein
MASTISRFDRFTPRDLSWQTYVPKLPTIDFQQWDSLLENTQTKYDAAIAATQKYPKHLQNRVDLAGQYKQSAVGAVDDITQTYMNEGLTSGNRKMRDFALKLNKDWQPGGLAYELEQEYNDYQTASQQIDKYYKDNKAENSVNRRFSMNQLQKSAQGEFKYNKEGDMYSRANIVADTRPYVDIMEEAQKVVKDIKENGTTDIIKMSPAWFEKIKTEEVTPETIKEVTNTLLQQPKYAEQRQLELWGEKQKYTPEQLTQLEEAHKTDLQSQYDKSVKQIEDLKSTKQGKKDLQEQLQKAGYYEGKIDGDFGKDSKAALDKFLNDSKTTLETSKGKVSADNILNNQLLDNYVAPLAAAYARKKVDKDLIFNQEWSTNAKIAAQRSNTQALVTAFQSLKNPPTGEYLPTPGLSRPMDTLDALKKQYGETLDASKKAFDVTSSKSGITTILGTSAPNTIHAATEARLKSSTPEEFQANLMNAGIVADASKLWDYYNSPGAENLQNSYLSMQQAKQDLEGAGQAQTDMFNNYFKTPEGKKELTTLRKNYNLKTESPEQISQLLTNNDKRFKTVQLDAGLMKVGDINVAGKIRENINTAMKNDPAAFPVALRGYAFNAIKGPGSDLEKVIVDDIKNGFTMGYNSDMGGGVQFKTIEQNGKGSNVKLEDIDMSKSELRFNVDAKGVTYYTTAKEKGENGKYVQSVMAAPKSHTDRLIQVALDMKKSAKDTKSTEDDALAEQMYAVLTKGPQIQNAVNDAFVVTPSNTKKLNNIIEPKLSKAAGTIRTFGENDYIQGVPKGSEINANGLIYQKFKVLNTATGDASYMTTYKTNGGWLPIENKSGGYYYKTSQEADSPIIDAEMMRQLPVEVDQKKVYQTNVSEEDAKSLLLDGGINLLNDNN